MRLHRFFISSNIDKEKINTFSSEGLLHQLRSVFRFHEGSQFICFNGDSTDHTVEIVSLTKKDVAVRVLETRVVKPCSARKLTLALSLIKKDNFEWVIQKGTELGVSEFIPLLSERSEKKNFNIERAQKILVEACEQSGRAELPTVREPLTLSDFLSEEKRRIICFHTEGPILAFTSHPEDTELVICIGPEGGWSEKEIALFVEKNATLMKLNTPVLRAETAAIAASAILLV